MVTTKIRMIIFFAAKDGEAVSCVVERRCLLWLVCSLDKSVRHCPALFCNTDQICLLFQVYLDFLLLHSNPLWWKGHIFLVLVIESLVGLQRTDQLQLLWPSWLGHRFELLWRWITVILNSLPWKWTEIILSLHMDITRWSAPKSDWLYSLQPKMEKLHTVSKNKVGSWVWLRSWTHFCQIQT